MHGGRGTFIASVSAMALITITSHHHLHRSHNTLSLHKSEVISRQIPSSAQQHLPQFRHGTRVTVRDLFGSLPVRVKQRAITAERQGGFGKDWDELKRRVVVLLLSWTGKLTVTVRGAETGQKFVLRSQPGAWSKGSDVLNICNILCQASYIDSAESASWVSLSASTSKLKVDGAISLSPAATKKVQFFSFGIHPLVNDGPNILYDEINRLFLNSAFGSEDDTPDLDDTDKFGSGIGCQSTIHDNAHKEPRWKRKAVDRWPMFYINIQQTDRSETLDTEAILDDKTNILLSIMQLLRAMIAEFLRTHNFQPKFTGHSTLQSQDGENQSEERAEQYSIGGTGESLTLSKEIPATKKAEPSAIQDTLSANIKLPSFYRDGTRLDSPLEAWSRVKKGVPHLRYGSLHGSGDMTSRQEQDFPRPSTAPLSTDIESRPLSPRPPSPESSLTSRERRTAPLVSAAGDIIRRPFGDLSIDKTVQIHARGTAPDEDQGPSHNDHMVRWMNPATKTASLVNDRTGLVTPVESNHKKGNTRLISLAATTQNAPLSSDPNPWLASVLNNWENPVFHPAEIPIPQVLSDSQGIGLNSDTHEHACPDSPFDFSRAFDVLPLEISGRISKNALRKAEVISQVDKKFILVKLHPSGYERTGESGPVLVMVDQHAADERVRVEALMRELCTTPDSDLPSGRGIESHSLDKSLSYILSSKDVDLLRTYQLHFAHWGIVYDLSRQSPSHHNGREDSIVVRSLPPGIIERCKATPRLLIELIRTEAWKLHDQGVQPHDTTLSEFRDGTWVSKIRTCPQGIIDMLNSRACRSAIMFNDELSKEQCAVIISRLAECDFPFQCAHGRPSLVPLVDLRSLGSFGNSTGVMG